MDERAVTPAEKTPRQRRWGRFSLRTMLLSSTIVCVWFGMLASSARRQQEAVEAIRKVYGTVPRRPLASLVLRILRSGNESARTSTGGAARLRLLPHYPWLHPSAPPGPMRRPQRRPTLLPRRGQSFRLNGVSSYAPTGRRPVATGEEQRNPWTAAAAKHPCPEGAEDSSTRRTIAATRAHSRN